jgi:NAD(P)-dependent dehydrogenase (short-subunit alcohol dehydrogenase family)
MAEPNPPTAVVCGAATPIGVALVERLRASGAAVIAVDLPGAVAAGADLQLNGDLAEDRDWPALAQAIQAHGAPPTMLAYLLAESEAPSALADLAQPVWDRVMNRNLRGAYLACRHLFPLMGRPGAAVLLASVLGGWDVRADSAALSASGGGVLALARSLAASGAPLGLRVNAVVCDAPLADWPEGPARDRALARTPLGRATTPGDVADAIMFLLSEDAGFLTGSELVVDGGQSLQSWSNAPDAPYSEL